MVIFPSHMLPGFSSTAISRGGGGVEEGGGWLKNGSIIICMNITDYSFAEKVWG